MKRTGYWLAAGLMSCIVLVVGIRAQDSGSAAAEPAELPLAVDRAPQLASPPAAAPLRPLRSILLRNQQPGAAVPETTTAQDPARRLAQRPTTLSERLKKLRSTAVETRTPPPPGDVDSSSLAEPRVILPDATTPEPLAPATPIDIAAPPVGANPPGTSRRQPVSTGSAPAVAQPAPLAEPAAPSQEPNSAPGHENSLPPSQADSFSPAAGDTDRMPSPVGEPAAAANSPIAVPQIPSAAANITGALPEASRFQPLPNPVAEPAPLAGPAAVQPDQIELGPDDSAAAVPPTSDEATLIVSATPTLRVSATGPNALQMGQSARYVVSVANESEIAAQGVFVRVTLPRSVKVETDGETSGAIRVTEEAGQQILVWNLDRVAARAVEQFILLATPTTNRPFDLLLDYTTRPVTSAVQVAVQQPQLEISVFGPRDILYGESAVYTIQLTNAGSGDARDVAVEFAYGSLRLDRRTIGVVKAGEQTEVSLELTAGEAGPLRLAAVANGANGLRAETVQEVLVRRPSLEVDVLGSQLKFAGAVANYQVRVRNSGNATATDVLAVITLPVGGVLLNSNAAADGGRVVQRIGNLAAGTERVFGIQCQLNQPGENRIHAQVQGGANLLANAEYVTQVDAIADLKLAVNDPQGPTALGENAVYEIHVANRGTKSAQDITIVAQFSDGIEPIEVSGASAELVPGQVLFKPIAAINPGEELTIKVVARADKPGNHRFRAEVACAQPDTKLVAEESTYYFGEETSRSTQRPVYGPAPR